MTTASQPLELIEEKPTRRSRAETILKMLTSSSYPHAFLANLAVGLAREMGNYSDNDLKDLAVDLRQEEKRFDMLDFVRVVDLRRKGDTLEIRAKKPKAIVINKTYVDNPATQHVFYQKTVKFSGITDTSDLSCIAHMIMMAHYRTQVLGPKRHDIATGHTWYIKTKTISTVGPALKDMRKTTNEIKASPTDVIRRIVKSLKNEKMSISMGPKAIILRDQSSRCWISHS